MTSLEAGTRTTIRVSEWYRGESHEAFLEEFQQVEAFLATLQERYPERKYPSSLTPHSAFFLAHNTSDQVVGIITGTISGGGASIRLANLLVDPEYDGFAVTKAFATRIGERFSEIHLGANPFGLRSDISDEDFLKRRRALVRFYEKFGFEVESSSQGFVRTESRAIPVQMVWRKP